MALFTLDVPDELYPALVAEYSIVSAAGATSAASPEEYFASSVVEIIRQRAEIYKVGPYFVGPVEPAFNADGTPNVPLAPEPPAPDPSVEDPIIDAPVTEPQGGK